MSFFVIAVQEIQDFDDHFIKRAKAKSRHLSLSLAQKGSGETYISRCKNILKFLYVYICIY